MFTVIPVPTPACVKLAPDAEIVPRTSPDTRVSDDAVTVATVVASYGRFVPVKVMLSDLWLMVPVMEGCVTE